MNAKEETPSQLDHLKWLVAVAIIVVGVVGNSYYAGESVLYRVLALVFLAAVAAGIALTTQKGAAFREMLKEARVELRKVVWPTRVETGQTTAIVVVVVLIVALILWALDSLFAWIIASLIG
ncbi:MAG: preprotein translocase subunit SecE [Litorivicinaceae bacterium]